MTALALPLWTEGTGDHEFAYVQDLRLLGTIRIYRWLSTTDNRMNYAAYWGGKTAYDIPADSACSFDLADLYRKIGNARIAEAHRRFTEAAKAQ